MTTATEAFKGKGNAMTEAERIAAGLVGKAEVAAQRGLDWLKRLQEAGGLSAADEPDADAVFGFGNKRGHNSSTL